MDLFNMSIDEFRRLFRKELEKIGQNASIIKHKLEKEGKSKKEIADAISSFFKSLGIRLSDENLLKIEKDLGLEENSLDLSSIIVKKDYEVIAQLYKKYKFKRLEFIIALLKAPNEHLPYIQEKLLLVLKE